MSIRLNGRIWRLPIADVHAKLVEVKPRIQDMRMVMLTDVVAKAVTDRLDMAARLKHRGRAEADYADLLTNPLSHVMDDIRKRQDRVVKERRRDPEVDHEFEVCLFPDGVTTLMTVHCEHRELLNVIDEMPDVQNYSYWDNTDPPEGITDAEWGVRHDRWEHVLGRRWCPADRGLTFKFTDTYMLRLPEITDVMTCIPGMDERIMREAMHVHHEEAIAKDREAWAKEAGFPYLGVNAIKQARDYPMSRVMQAVMDANEDEERRRQIVREVRPYIRPLTRQDVLGWDDSKKGE